MRRLFLGVAVALTTASMLFAGGQGESTAASPAQTGDGKPTITFMLTDFSGHSLKNENSDKVIAACEDYTGTHVTWRFEQDSTYEEKLGITLMDKENMPMILTCKRSLSSNIISAAQQGAFWDLSNYIFDEKEYPNLSKANKDVLKALTVDGQVIGIYRARAIGRNGFSYRKDWAEKVGITKDPQTVQDVYDMMYKFTYGDPDGNGKNDTYGLELTKWTGPLDVIQTWFGCGNEWVLQDGKLIPVHQTKEFMEALDWMAKMYADGLVRKDWPTVDSGTFSDACKKGTAGIFIDVMDGAKRVWQYYVKNKIPSVMNPAESASMVLQGPVAGHTLATTGFNGYYVITKAGAKTEQDLKNCLHFLDKMCDDKMMVLADYGIEGLTYDMVDGHVVLRKFDTATAPQNGLNQSVCYIPNLSATNPTLNKDAPTKAQDDAYANNLNYAVFNPALGYLANSPINAEVGTDIEQIIDDARTQYICGQIDKKGFEKAAQQWLDRGGAKLIEEVNALYQKDKNK